MSSNGQFDPGNVRHFRAIWMSDFHLGSLSSKTDSLLEFLNLHETDTLYLVGDILDIRRLSRRWFWPSNHTQVIARILRKARQGTRVIYIPGNHDSVMRSFAGENVAGVEIHHDFMHTTVQGKRLLVMHGDEFHGVLRKEHEAHLGECAFDALIAIDCALNRLCQHVQPLYTAVSASVKRTAKQLSTAATRYVRSTAQEACRRGADGVICGHNHQPQLKQFGEFLYCNDGDWVESCTALVETFDGDLLLAKHDGNDWCYSPLRKARYRRKFTRNIRNTAQPATG